MDTRIFAYIRISSKDQNADRQLDAISPYHLPKERIFLDKQSGKDFDRPQYKRLLRILKAGDLVIIKSIDRLGRNYEEIIEQWKYITSRKKADIKVLDMPLLDTTQCKDLLGTLISDLVLQLLSFAAQNERENIHTRQAEGIASAKARGIRFGRPPKDLPPNFDSVCRQWRCGQIQTRDAVRILKIPRSTFLRKAKNRDVS